MLEFIAKYWDSILVVVLFILLVLFLIKRGSVKKVKEMLFYLVTEAEKQFGGGTGALKYAAVTTWIYERLPSILKIIFTDKQIDKMIEKAVADMKKYLEENADARVFITE